LAYSSAAVDGRSQATNNQPSWVGEGFDWWPGYIERRYKPCADDGHQSGDLCWGTDNATMSLNGGGGELVRDTATGAWRLKDDDASTVERLTNTVNGDSDNEYWKVTTAEGTQYYFGRHRLPGHTGTAPADKVTNSVWTVPVSGNNAGEPCHASSFIASFCTQAWRWNLDYVVDTHGNTMSLYYRAESNMYARDNTDSDAVSYVRGGWLDHIDYGTDNRTGADTVNTATNPPMRVTFVPGDRCLSSCWSGSNPVGANWPDTPWDQRCVAGPCVGNYSPTFFTAQRLTSVTTKVWNATTSSYKDVDTWTLSHTFPSPGDGTRAGLWLESIVHTGKSTGSAVIGGDVAMPEVNFDWVQMPNRVDTLTDGQYPMNWMRMSTIWTDTGGKIDVRYSGPECVPGTRMPPSPQTNTLRCYPVLSERPDGSLKTEYFHKYLVQSVTEADRTGGSPDVVTSYQYLGGAAWAHTDDDGITNDKLRTWSDYRGYATVETRVGDPGSQTLTVATYFRGIGGSLAAVDGNGDGDTSDTADAPPVTDEAAFAGMVRTSTVYNGVTTAPVSRAVNEPWQSAPTGSRDMGQTTVYARYTGTRTTWGGVAQTGGGWLVTRSDSDFDSYGMVTQIDDYGDAASTGDEQCTRTTYNRNTGINLLTLAGRVEKYALRCGTAPTSEAQVISDARTSFDGKAYGIAPTIGDATRAEVAKAWTAAGGPTWLTETTAVYDNYGRQTDVTDARGNHTTIVVVPVTGGPVTSTEVTTPLGKTTTTTEPSWGTPTATVDANNKRTEATVDALGRTRQVWLANRPKAQFPNDPSSRYTYQVRNGDGVNAVIAEVLNAATSNAVARYTTSYTLYDGLLRLRQTQTISKAVGNVGTVFAETKYDSGGRAISQSTHFDPNVAPSTTLFTIADWQPLTQTVTAYDRAGRKTASIFRSAGSELWRTTTSYEGNRTHTVPPTGGTATTTITDARGRTVESRQYHSPADAGSNTRSLYDAVTYHYDGKGQQDRIADNAGNAWTYGYDLLGRQTATHDPDTGDSSTTYNDAGDVVSATDARGQTLVYTYDGLGRKTGQYVGSVATANKLATWAYDPPGFKGQLTSSSRWLNNGTEEYRIKIRSYTQTYQPTGEDYTIPASLTGLGRTYSISRTYRVDGSPDSLTYPDVAGMGQETVTTTYDPVTGLPEQLQTNTGESYYVFNTDYTAYGELGLVEYKTGVHSFVQRAFYHDDATRRLNRALTIRQIAPQAVDDTTYGYDPAGNVRKIQSTSDTGAVDTQCFDQDYAQRLVDAWTPASGDCGLAKSTAGLGGPARYWQSWTFDAAGNRASQTTHATGGDSTTSYTYPAAGSAQPHTLMSTTDGTTTQSYRYDAAGNTTCRPAAAGANTCPTGTGNQTLTWDAEGNLATASDATGTSRYTYTADGTRLVADDPSTTTLYLPGTEVRRTRSTGAVAATRYYSWAGQTCAMKTSGGGAITWLLGDHQGTQTVAVAAGPQTVTTRRQTPYGQARGTVPTWPNPKGFVGGDRDATGLTHLGAREYDATTGRFVSGDPIFDAADPQSWTGYAYAGNSPVTSSDASGLMREDTGGGGSTSGGSSEGCDDVHAYGQSSCAAAGQGSGGKRRTRASNTTREREMDACYQLARARATCNYNTSPLEQVARYEEQTELENNRRHAEVEAAIIAEQEAQRTADANNCAWYNPLNCAKKVGNWALVNIGMIVNVGATVGCLVPAVGWAACAGLQALAFGARTFERARENGGLANTWRETVADGVFTAVTLGGGAAFQNLRYGKAGWGLLGAPKVLPNLKAMPTGGPLLRIRQMLWSDKTRDLPRWQRDPVSSKPWLSAPLKWLGFSAARTIVAAGCSATPCWN
jgi:RHS repeat-associated protein